MSPITVVAHLLGSDKSGRDKVIDALTKIKDYAYANEPGVTKYCLTIPQDVKDELSIYMIEEYQDQAAMDAHVASPPVAAMIQLTTSNPTLLQGPPTIHKLHRAATFTRPSVTSHTDPYIVFGTLTYKSGTRDTAVDGFATVCKRTEETEQGTLSYTIFKDEDDDKLRTVEAYESEAYLWDPHAKSEAVKENMERTGDTRTNRELVFLKLVSGYFYKK